MKVLAVLLAVGAASALKYFPNHQPLSDELIAYINEEARTTWTAGKNFEGRGVTTTTLKRMCGVIPEPNGYKLPYREPHVIEDIRDLPTNFDSRTQWPKCKSIS